MQKIDFKLKGKSGIYMIVNLLNGKRYVGSSVDIYNRLHEHQFNLIKNKAHNVHLQSAWNKYGEDAFIWTVLEFCEKDKRFDREQYFIDFIKPEYNFTENVVANFGHSPSKECRQKISETLKKRYAAKEIVTYKQQHAWIKCYLYDANTYKLISEFENMRECASYLNITCNSTEKLVGRLIKNKYIVVTSKFSQELDVKNYIYKYIKKIKFSPVYGDRYLVAEKNNKIEYFDSIKNCANTLGISSSMIIKHLSATKQYPYIPTKNPTYKIYFIKEYIPYDAV